MRQGTRKVLNKKTKQIKVQYAHLINGQYVFLELNNNFEVLR